MEPMYYVGLEVGKRKISCLHLLRLLRPKRPQAGMDRFALKKFSSTAESNSQLPLGRLLRNLASNFESRPQISTSLTKYCLPSSTKTVTSIVLFELRLRRSDLRYGHEIMAIAGDLARV